MENFDEKLDKNLEKGVEKIKEVITKPLPKAPSLHEKASAHELKKRLEWGEPALTIIDVRDRETFNNEHIMGAMAMPFEMLVDTVQTSNMATSRDIYIYGESDEDSVKAASALREAGYMHVAQLQGGLAGWKAIGGPTEGRDAHTSALGLNERLAHPSKNQ